jgi:flagellin-like hook-associated protein FlgL
VINVEEGLLDPAKVGKIAAEFRRISPFWYPFHLVLRFITILQNVGRHFFQPTSVKVGALSALYQRIMWLSDPANSPLETGNGYDIFSKNAENIDGAPDQQIFNGSRELISALTKSLNELVDGSILQINAHRSYFGAYAGRMEHNIANLAAQSENLTAAGSRIRDTDYGAETASLTRTQILQQAATAMLAQANAMPNVVLALLRQQ